MRSAPDPALLQDQLTAFMDEHIYPNEARYHTELNALENRFSTVPLMEDLKARARDQGLWNLWLPKDHGGMSNADYAPLAEIMGHVLWAPEVFNCNAPDTGNMEVFLKYGTPDQQEQWLEPLMAGEIRSSYAMTEPDVASSDATNVQTRIERDGDHYVVRWSQMVHHQRAVRTHEDLHRDGQIGSGQSEPTSAAEPDSGTQGHAGCVCGSTADHTRLRRRAAGPRRSAL